MLPPGLWYRETEAFIFRPERFGYSAHLNGTAEKLGQKNEKSSVYVENCSHVKKGRPLGAGPRTSPYLFFRSGFPSDARQASVSIVETRAEKRRESYG